MSSQVIPVGEFDYVVFGATGDLSKRKLLPALYHRFVDGQFSEPSRIIGSARTEMDCAEFRQFAEQALKANVAEELLEKAALAKFLKLLFYLPIDAKSDTGWAELVKQLDNKKRISCFYLAVSPSIFGDIAAQLEKHNLITSDSRLVIEKPIGHDLESARQLNQVIGQHFREDQLFRIDHYLGKETVQNLLVLRFANALYEPLWNATYIDHVQITVAETLGVEGRGNYYDHSGAIRDMVQNHLLQLLCLVAMEPPASVDANAVRDEKLKVLRSLKPITAKNVNEMTVRGQYSNGSSKGKAVPGYLDEIDNKSSTTETLVAIKAEIENWRWSGVPFYLRTGKRLQQRASEIVIQFKPVPHFIFGEESHQKNNAGQTDTTSGNRLVLRLQPDEGVNQEITIKDPGLGGLRLKQVSLDMSFAEVFDSHTSDAYERLLLDVVRGNQTLFMRRDEVEAAWNWVDPIIKAWQETGQKPAKYSAGSWGPSQSIALIERDGRTWYQDEE